MKKFIGGLSTGYLLTSLFSIQAPPSIFWYGIFIVAMLSIPVGYLYWRINNDLQDGEY